MGKTGFNSQAALRIGMTSALIHANIDNHSVGY
jgi:hypothetical protein